MTLSEERGRDYFLHLVNGLSYAPKTLRQARAALICFFSEMLGVADWRVLYLQCAFKEIHSIRTTHRRLAKCERSLKLALAAVSCG